MAIRYTDFFQHDNQEFALFVLEKMDESGEKYYTIHIKSEAKNTAVLCKRRNTSWEIISQDIPSWVREFEDTLLDTLAKRTIADQVFFNHVTSRLIS